METVFGLIVEAVFIKLGALIKRLLGLPVSELGYSETWIGALFVAAVVGTVVLLIYSF